MFRFANAEYLYLLIAIPFLLALFYLAMQIRRRAIKRFGDPSIISELMPEASSSRPWVKASILSLVAISLIFALARPQLGSKLKDVKRKGVELIICLDVSNSMLAQDIKPNRLERAKQAIAQMVDKLTDDRIGLIVFAGDAYVQLPVTSDYVSAKMFLNTINPGIVPVQGTAIGKAIELGINSFTPESEKSRVMVIITDGENHEDDAIAAAHDAAEKGIVIHTIGVGSPQGAPIPLAPGSTNFLTDSNGKIVVTKLDESVLMGIAAATGGRYTLATNSSFGLNEVLADIRKMDKQNFNTKVYSEYDDKFQYFLWFALFLLFVEYFILERKNRWQEKLEIFKARLK
ncbi:MAG TPA: VWA domain-containing protein [Williamwhitmania sp.]|nr:VWA domain-containing protein [Williamwhitmania sp.]